VSWLVRLYPAAWRRRYGDELETVLAAQAPSLLQALDVLRGALDAWLHPELAQRSPRAFARLAEPAHRVLALAQDEARGLGHRYLGTEHLLLGLTRADGGAAARVLEDLGVRPDDVRARIEAIVGLGTPARPANRRGRCARQGLDRDMCLTERTKRVFERAAHAADRQHAPLIGELHLLLGILEQGEGVAAAVLRELGVRDSDAFRRRVREALAQHPS
jgi:ATP-dependent Clp protease ATP-binding subunit ClpC